MCAFSYLTVLLVGFHIACGKRSVLFKIQPKSAFPTRNFREFSLYHQQRHQQRHRLHLVPVEKGEIFGNDNILDSVVDKSLSAEKLLSPPGNVTKSKDFTRDTYIVLSLLFLVTALCSLDRVAMSVAIIPMGVELHYTEEMKGAVSTLFSFGYLFGMIPAGLLGSFTSPKNVLGLGVLLWSVAQTLSPLAAHTSLTALYFTRFCMGASEAVTIPTVQNFVSRFVPDEKKSVVLGIVLSGLQVGNVGAFLISPLILDTFGWTGVLIAYGALGLLWLSLWLPFAKDNTSGTDISDKSQIDQPIDTTIVPIKATFQSAVTAFRANVADVPFAAIVSAKEVQAIAVAHAVQNFGLYINLAWLPTYFNQKYGLSVDDSSFSSVLPWVAGAIVGPLSGWLADQRIAAGVDRTIVRKAAQIFALIVPAAALLTLSTAPADMTSTTAIALFVVAVASAAVCVAGFGASVQDICASSKYVSVVYSLTSAPAVLMGSAGVYLTGRLLDSTHSFSLAFQGVAVIYLIGATFYALNYEAKKIIE